MTKQDLLLKHLKAGKAFTPRQITASFGIAHPASTVRNLREQGYCVYSNPATVSDGTETVKYRIGTPSRRMIALAQKIAGAGVFARS
jgi:hypothetical protein